MHLIPRDSLDPNFDEFAQQALEGGSGLVRVVQTRDGEFKEALPVIATVRQGRRNAVGEICTAIGQDAGPLGSS